MNDIDKELEQMFAAGARHRDDQRRQKELTDMIDRMAEADVSHRTKRVALWRAVAVAASIAMVVGSGYYMMHHSDNQTGDAILTASNDTQGGGTTYVAQTEKDSEAEEQAVPTVERGKQRRTAFSKTKEEQMMTSEMPASAEMVAETKVLTEETEHKEEREEEEVVAEPTQPHVYERTSIMLVCDKNCRPARSRAVLNDDAPQLALVNGGTQTTFELGQINF